MICKKCGKSYTLTETDRKLIKHIETGLKAYGRTIRGKNGFLEYFNEIKDTYCPVCIEKTMYQRAGATREGVQEKFNAYKAKFKF